jgi:hypothetical protein
MPTRGVVSSMAWRRCADRVACVYELPQIDMAQGPAVWGDVGYRPEVAQNLLGFQPN